MKRKNFMYKVISLNIPLQFLIYFSEKLSLLILKLSILTHFRAKRVSLLLWTFLIVNRGQHFIRNPLLFWRRETEGNRVLLFLPSDTSEIPPDEGKLKGTWILRRNPWFPSDVVSFPVSSLPLLLPQEFHLTKGIWQLHLMTLTIISEGNLRALRAFPFPQDPFEESKRHYFKYISF